MNLNEAYDHCKQITTSHYENFPVASRLLPKNVRRHIYPIYAFARHGDDLADEYHDKPGLLAWRKELHNCLEIPSKNPIFFALANTIREKDLPISLLDDLLTAFLQDLSQNRYNDLIQLKHYCHYSANPVGRLILLLHNYKSEKLFVYSDSICTALQLTNFWQDVHVDANNDHIYIPQDHLEKYGISEKQVFEKKNTPSSRKMMIALVNETESLFYEGLPLLHYISGRLKWELKFTVLGGLSILDKIKKNDYNVFSIRPEISKWDGVKIIASSFIRDVEKK